MAIRVVLSLILFNVVLTVTSKTYNNGLIFFNLHSNKFMLPPAVTFVRSRGVQTFFPASMWSQFGPPCTCDKRGCACCAGLKVQEHDFNEKMCANVTYNGEYEEARLNVFLSNANIAKYGISARNPSPLCMPLMMPIPMSMCIQMSNVGLQGDNLHMCMDWVVRMHTSQIMQLHFNCMKMGLDGFQYLNPQGESVFPSSRDGLDYDEEEDEDDENENESESDRENEIDDEEDDDAEEDDKYVRVY